MSRALAAGEQVILLDKKDRHYMITLAEDAEFHTHAGFIPHADIIGQNEGCVVRTGSSAKYLVVRPTLTDYVLKMPRGAQVIYPKDLGPILIMADIYPGARVLESGVGSGALSMTMVRAGAEVTGYEIREDFAQNALKNVRTVVGEEAMSRYNVEIRDIYEGIDLVDLDRIVLDLPEPWEVVKHAEQALHPGGILLSYVPSIMQVSQLREALAASSFGMEKTVEFMERGWKVEGNAVRPDHRMVAHTGFLTSARLLAPADE